MNWGCAKTCSFWFQSLIWRKGNLPVIIIQLKAGRLCWLAAAIRALSHHNFRANLLSLLLIANKFAMVTKFLVTSVASSTILALQSDWINPISCFDSKSKYSCKKIDSILNKSLLPNPSPEMILQSWYHEESQILQDYFWSPSLEESTNSCIELCWPLSFVLMIQYWAILPVLSVK